MTYLKRWYVIRPPGPVDAVYVTAPGPTWAGPVGSDWKASYGMSTGLYGDGALEDIRYGDEALCIDDSRLGRGLQVEM